MDDLDKELFGSAFKKNNTPSSVPKAQRDFDDEDPLKDLLSSGDEGTPVKRVQTKVLNKETPDPSRQQSKNKLISDLFGLNEKEEGTNPSGPSKAEDPGDWLGLKADPDIDNREQLDMKLDKYIPTNAKSHTLSKVSGKQDELLSGLGSRENSRFTNLPKTPPSFALDDSKQTPIQRKSGADIQEPKKSSSILSSFISDFDSKPAPFNESSKGQEITSGLENAKNSYSMPSISRESRRNTRKRGGDLADPLGLFSSSTTEQPNGTNSKETQGAVKEVEPSRSPAAKVSQIPSSDQVPNWLGGAGTQPVSSPSSHANVAKATVSQDDAGLESLEMRAGDAAAQQQKSLITALALKRQEDALLKLQAQQAALLASHEQQLGALVQRQVQRQQQMLLQQEQIQAHIQTLMMQPPPIPSITLPSTLWNIEESLQTNSDSQIIIDSSRNQTAKHLDVISELKNQVQRLEIENNDLRAHLESEKEKHKSSLADMENLFRKQLAAQEEAMIKQEKRHCSEIDAYEKEATSRISRLKDDHDESSRQQVQRMAQLHGEWLADLQRLGEFHQQAVEVLRSEQTSAIEHWKNLQLAEIAAGKEAHLNARLLETAVNHLQESSASITSIKDHLKREADSLHSDKHDDLLKQEAQLSALKDALEKQAAALDVERLSLLTLNRDLESRVLRQQQEVNEERRRFEAREKAWEREKLGAIDLLNQEKQHLEKLQLQAQTELNELAERKLTLTADVARLETTLHIQSTNANRNSQQAEQMVAEARSMLEAAHEAGTEVQKEREDIRALKNSLTAEQKRISVLEKEIQARERRLMEETVKAQSFKEEGVSALEEARRLERERTEHASDLAQRLLHLKEREDRLAEEKLAVTMEWKKIQETRENVVCSSCGQTATGNLSSYSSPKNIVDPLPLILKLEAEQGLDFISLDNSKYHTSFLESVSQ
ncbi:hypothetical protein ONE63_006127 [Megalurothrips usitatus]|uniref:Fas-binding factor 1 C-terminal domain-containing protein n=1 Tax=Megalurothrips usitatus TaxID=439358 RepID=A0AAV7XSE5_9NEOP|nr:hypothetical protein ONE63_006127 [Megalurothrips usitatus]